MPENQFNSYKTENIIDNIKARLNNEKNASSKNYNKTENPQAFNIRDIRKPLAIFSYIPILWIISLIIYPRDEYVKFHVNQGILLNIAYLVLKLFISIINTVFILISPLSIFVTSLLSIIAVIIILSLVVLGVLNAYSLKNRPLPIIGEIFNFFEQENNND